MDTRMRVAFENSFQFKNEKLQMQNIISCVKQKRSRMQTFPTRHQPLQRMDLRLHKLTSPVSFLAGTFHTSTSQRSLLLLIIRHLGNDNIQHIYIYIHGFTHIYIYMNIYTQRQRRRG